MRKAALVTTWDLQGLCCLSPCGPYTSVKALQQVQHRHTLQGTWQVMLGGCRYSVCHVPAWMGSSRTSWVCLQTSSPLCSRDKTTPVGPIGLFCFDTVPVLWKLKLPFLASMLPQCAPQCLSLPGFIIPGIFKV